MQIIDWVVIALFVLYAVVGAIKGFWSQLFGLIALLASVGGTLLLFGPISSALTAAIPDIVIRSLVAALIPFVLILIIVYVVKGLLWNLIKRVKILKTLDRILGVVFGMATIYVAFAVITPIVLNVTVEGNEQIATVLAYLRMMFEESKIINAIYGQFNPIGDLVLQAIGSAIG